MTLITGGCRSGKSRFAERAAEQIPGRRVYVATCPIIDEEISERIARHRQRRSGKGWDTVEAPTALAETIRDIPDDATVLVDCLTLWVNNLLYEAELDGRRFSEDDMRLRCEALEDVCGARQGRVIFVTDEVGMGIVPADPTSRLYRDLIGRCNQELAAVCDEVIFMAAGLPLYLKERR